MVSDTMGRPWRTGVVDVAIGAAGVRAVDDLRGATDTHGLRLEMTEVAVADELAAAAELAKGKLAGVPVAVVRGLSPVDDPGRRRCAAAAVRRRTCSGSAPRRRSRRAGARHCPMWTPPAPPVHADAVGLLGRAAHDPDLGQQSLGAGAAVVPAGPPGRDPPGLPPRPPHRQHAWCWTPPASTCCSPCTRGSAPGSSLGGHIEPEDDTVLAAATREAPRRAGSTACALDPVPIYLGVHPVTCSLGVPTRHLDVTFLAVAPAGALPVRSDESDDLGWFPVGALPDGVVPDLPALLGPRAWPGCGAGG